MEKVHSFDSSNIKVSAAGLALAALALAAPASATGDHGRRHAHTEVHGRVEVVKEIPGGVVTVGVEVGRPRAREVVVVERERPQVIVVKQEERCYREPVTIIRKEYGRTVIIKRDHRGREVSRVIVVKEERGRGHGKHGRGHRGRGKGHGKHGHDRDDGAYERYYGNDGVIYEARADENGSYRYYEDDRMVSIQEVRDGQSRNVYVRK